MTNHRYPASCWLAPNATVRRSGIEGQGLFATAQIPGGEEVMRLGGKARARSVPERAAVKGTQRSLAATVLPGRAGQERARTRGKAIF